MMLIALLADFFIVEPPPVPESTVLEGRFDAPPVEHWRMRLPERHPSFSHTELSRPASDGDSIFVGIAAVNALVQLDRATGEVVSRYKANAPVQSEPVLVDGTVTFTDGAGYTWRYEVGARDHSWVHYGGAPITSAPTVTGNRVFVASVDDVVYALNASDGALVWRYSRPPDAARTSELALFGAPSPVIAGRLVLAGFNDGALVGLAADDGEVNWERRVGEGRYPDLIAPPLVDGTDCYVGGYSEPLVSLDLVSLNVRWRLDVGSAAPPLLTGEVLYHGGVDGKLRAIDRQTGAEQWVWDSDTDGALTQPQLLEAGLLVASSEGALYLVDPSTGELSWEYDPGFMLDGITVAPLVVGRQLVAVTNAGWVMSLLAPRPGALRQDPLLGANAPL